ncbi:exodeoxyribonuclease VII large subunit [Motiliproteus sp.]|uniref:exodeoxyribonuclease VII large subunit n=1 Tax=Motiliproteus sp. TaxID=1898955 RepID=UPI003BAC5A36
MQQSSSEIFSVSSLNQQARLLLESGFGLLQVEGEISNFVCPSSGHWYFTLKDERAQVRCALFRNRSRYLKYRPQNGDRVLLRAKVSLYEGRGEFQLIGDYIEPAGSGDLQAAFEALKNKLQLEGLFEPEHKKPLPDHPQHIGVITSPTGAAIQDILSVLKRRFPAIPVSLYPAAVQGDEAPAQLRQALALAQRDQRCDVLVIGRGGGSAEDLCAFNDEALARDIFNCPIPIVSAVGHEIDFSIADFVADLRAPTPSAAAEQLSPDRQQLLQRFELYQQQLSRQMQQRLQRHRYQCESLRARLRHPGQRLQEQSQRLDSLELRLRQATENRLQRQRLRLAHLRERLQSRLPQRQVNLYADQLPKLELRLKRAIEQQLQRLGRRLGEQAHALNTVSPLATLDRGYSISRNESNQLVRDSEQLKVGDRLHTRLAKGELVSQVTEVIPALVQPQLELD